jgi:hypothetical protein
MDAANPPIGGLMNMAAHDAIDAAPHGLLGKRVFKCVDICGGGFYAGFHVGRKRPEA